MYHSGITHDAALPLTWIPTRGNDIPPNAVPLHDGPNGRLYIARGLVGGEMRIGTASHFSSDGAKLQGQSLSYVVFEYEVLTCASSLRFELEDNVPIKGTSNPPPHEGPEKLGPFSAPIPHDLPVTIHMQTVEEKHQNGPPPYTSPRDDRVDVPKQPRASVPQRREDVQFKHLAQSKCFTLIDDTLSMQSSWQQTREALIGVVDVLSKNDKWDGLDVRFLHHAEAHSCIKTKEKFERVFDSVTTRTGGKTMTEKVNQIFRESLPLVEEESTARPVVLLIITDGIATDTQPLFDTMAHFCRTLNEKHVAPHLYRIHMLQMGADRSAVKPLHDFRDQMTGRDRDRRILNVVSFHRGRGLLGAKHIIELLLASTRIPIEEEPDFSERHPPEVIRAQYQALESIREMGS